MHMKRMIFAAASVLILFAACKGEKKHSADTRGNTRISGIYKNGKGKVIMAGKADRGRFKELAKDSIEDERFLLAFDLQRPEVLYLQVPRTMDNNILFVEPGETVELEINGDLQHMKIVKGSAATRSFARMMDIINEYRKKEKELEAAFKEATRKGDQSRIEQLRKQYFALQDEKKAKLIRLAEENKDNYTAAFILQVLSADPEADFVRLKKLYDSLPPEIKNSDFAKEARQNIETNLITAIGKKAPDFKGPTPEGDTLRMSDVLKKSKVLVLDFWASWCRPCRAENPYVVEIYNKYHDKGLNILGISLDKPNARDKWLKAIKDDQLNWYHVSYLKYWQDPIARQYGIRSIPTTLILDKNGVIRAKNLRREKLEAKIKELLNE